MIYELLICLAPILVVPAGEKPTRQDIVTMARAKKECTVRYPKSPCLKSVTRKKNNHYQVLCSQRVRR